MLNARLSAALLALAILASAARAQQDILIADFEGSTYGQWTATGDAFGTGPAHGALPRQRPVSGFAGKGLINTYLNGDKATGTLTSPPFKIERTFINFLIGGGAHEGQTCINLLLDDKVVRSTTGPDNEELEWSSWDVGGLAGKTVRIRIVDAATGGWGHINVDQIAQSNTKKLQEPLVEELYNETYRPQFHFSPRSNWTNDPNGLVFYKGEYHLFFQHNPTGIKWGNMTWGHAVSKDLVHWEQLPNAIDPDSLGTIFSGSAVIDWNNTAGFGKEALVCIYTAAGGSNPQSKGQPFTQCLACSTDTRTFTKYDKNPVLKHIIGGNRDPKVIWHEPTKKWIMVLFLDKNNYGFFSSPDLKNWTHLHDITVPGCGECPDFFPLPVDGKKDEVKWVWTAANGKYLVGSFDGQKFTPDDPTPQPADWGSNYYAVQTYSDIPDSDGRRIQIAWMRGGQYPKMPFNQQMSFPCEMKLRRFPEGLRICRTPVKEIDLLHAREHSFKDLAPRAGENPLSAISGDLFDIRAEIDPGSAAELGFKVRGETIAYLPKEKKLSCLGKTADLPLDGGPIRLQILVDRAGLEIFANDGKVAMTSCFLPKPQDKTLVFYCTGGQAKVATLDVFELKSAWRNK